MSLFRRYLFPPCQDFGETSSEIKTTPLLDIATRQIIYNIIFHNIKDDAIIFRSVLRALQAIVPYRVQMPDGIPYEHPVVYSYDRDTMIRSPTGYVGLVNYGSTCYINALIAQLFMNVGFRNLMLAAKVSNEDTQTLLLQTQFVFASMQDSVSRYTEPCRFIESIRTYDNTPIDVNIQMDADEFFNLLFDRWEGQMLDSGDSRDFRTFFGGQLIQQIKSTECEHISSRLEPFSAIQCDIKGKSTLQESLQAYVEGEIMDGENKYKCEICNRHVDAVKRACLKNTPDNLIFHLKRFAYSVRTGMRSKINDRFEFPRHIDMRPYTLEHLDSTQTSHEADMFELVGVLVHAGTAESGHYYSYVKEQSSTTSKDEWFQFNDDTVTNWDINDLQDHTFGGINTRSHLDNEVQYDKNYSAYMLFYQRLAAANSSVPAACSDLMSSPIKIEVPPSIAAHISDENEIALRRYCLFDPAHAAFVLRVFNHAKQLTKDGCTREHKLEKLNMVVVLSHLDQVVSRTRNIPDFQAYIGSIRKVCTACVYCAFNFIDYFCERLETVRYLFVKMPDINARTEIASAIISALKKIKKELPAIYGPTLSGDSDGNANPPKTWLIRKFVRVLTRLWDGFHTHSRSWQEYFGLLLSIMSMGDFESALILDEGFLNKTLEMIMADRALKPSLPVTRMINMLEKRPATKPVSFDAVLSLLHALLTTCNLDLPAIDGEASRIALAMKNGHDHGLPLTKAEITALQKVWTQGQRHILTERLLCLNQNELASHGIIVELLRHSEALVVDDSISSAITWGLKTVLSKASSSLTVDPYLRAALTYCENSESPNGLFEIVRTIARVTCKVDGIEGQSFLQFFVDVLRLKSNHHEIAEDDIFVALVTHAHYFATTLLLNSESTVRTSAENFLRSLIFDYGLDFETEAADEMFPLKADTIVKAARDIGIDLLRAFHERYLVHRQQAVRHVLINALRVIDACRPYYGDEDDEKTMEWFRLYDCKSHNALHQL